MTPASFAIFPLDVQKRVIYYSLALPPSLPAAISSHDPVTPAWDSSAGQNGRRAIQRRTVERLGTRRAALNLMRVCKAWKSETLKYLYTEPYIHADNLCYLAAALVRGDRKWDDLHLHPHSIPGRYLTTLDLSHLQDPYYSLHSTIIARACTEILQLVPNLTHLKVPAGGVPFRLDTISSAPCARRLKALEGLEVDYEANVDVRGRHHMVELLRHLPNLEVLSLHGPGDVEGGTWEQHKQAPLQLDKLHILTLYGIKTGILLDTLVDSELLALRRLVLTSYYQHTDDLTLAFQQAHGHDILSLTYLPTREWPFVQSVPAAETLDLHPNLIHLSFLLQHDLSQASTILNSATSGPSPHPLRSLTLPKWNSTGTASPAPTWDHNTNAPAQPVSTADFSSNSASRFFRTLLSRPPPQLALLNIDGFRWVRVELGLKALMTGDSREMRVWSEKLKEVGIEMRDVDGKTAPVMENIVIEQARGRRRMGIRLEGVVRPERMDEDEDGA